MDIPSSVLNHPFELAPVLIPGWVTELRPVGIAYAGIPHSLFGTGGLQCVISAWTELKSGAWTMAAYDRVDLYVNDVLIPKAGFTVQPGQENEDFYPLYLPQGELREGVNKLHYKVTRFSGNSDVSNPIDVLYHLRAPGEPEPEGLDLVIPPDVISDGVSAERAAQGVEFGFTYSNRRDYDRINFLVGNVTVPFEVLDGSVPVTHTLFTDTFKQAGDNPKTPLQFTVTDQLGNSNTSSIEYLDIHLDRVLIVPTLTSVKDATGKEIPDAGETTSTTLTLSGQASNGKEVEIYDGSGASAVSKGRATADATTGLWSINITVPVGNRRLYAKSLYHPTNVYSNVRTLTVIELLAPVIVEAKGYHLDLADVPDSGATVRIGAEAQLKRNDAGEVRWAGRPGAGSDIVPFLVNGDEEGGDKTVRVKLSVVQANDGASITLDYTINRAAGGPPEHSPPAVYDVGREIGSGQLFVMGARGASSITWTGESGSRHLTALDATTRCPLEALWQYEGDENTPVRGSIFRDVQPWRMLQVRTSDDEVRINPANLFGNGTYNKHLPDWAFSVFVARRDRGTMVGWGVDIYGGYIPGPILTLDDILQASGTIGAFAARRANGHVVAWGEPIYGSTVPDAIAGYADIAQVVSSGAAFAVRRDNGYVAAWGDTRYGGSVPQPIPTLSDIVQVAGSGTTADANLLAAFVARRASGHVVAWGSGPHGGVVPTEIAILNDIIEICASTHHAFAARRANGAVVAWGHASWGGGVPDTIATLNDIEGVIGTAGAFAARRANGAVVAWGDGLRGGAVPPQIAMLTDIVEIVSTSEAFAARRASGHVVAWGDALLGGTLPPSLIGLDDIVQVTATAGAFAALRANGTVVVWGHSAWGGDASGVVHQLIDVRAVYANTQAFVALTSDGQVVTWGLAGAGGNSDAVQGQLRGQVSYEATPASRGVASMTLAAAAARA